MAHYGKGNQWHHSNLPIPGQPLSVNSAPGGHLGNSGLYQQSHGILPHPQTMLDSRVPSRGGSRDTRVSSGIVTNLHDTFGIIDDEVFFQLNVVKGGRPKIGDRVEVEATYSPELPFKWNATHVQLDTYGSPYAQGVQDYANRDRRRNRFDEPLRDRRDERDRRRDLSPERRNFRGGDSDRFRARPDPDFDRVYQRDFDRDREPHFDRRGDQRHGRSRDSHRGHPDRRPPLRSRETRRRTPDSVDGRRRSRSYSPLRPSRQYVVHAPKFSFDVEKLNIPELKRRYSKLYIPSDFSEIKITWQNTFTFTRPLEFANPSRFQIMPREVEPLIKPPAVETPSLNYSYRVIVMLLGSSPIDSFYNRCCELAEGSNRDGSHHPSRLLNFLVGKKGKSDILPIGGAWCPELDGDNPLSPETLINTAIRTTKNLTGVDLSKCNKWSRIAELCYIRPAEVYHGKETPEQTERVVFFLPDVWTVMPTIDEWSSLQQEYNRLCQSVFDKEKEQATTASQSTVESVPDTSDQAESKAQETPVKSDDTNEVDVAVDHAKEDAGESLQTHTKDLSNIKNMKVAELKAELESRGLSPKGLKKSQLVTMLEEAMAENNEKEDSPDEECNKQEPDSLEAPPEDKPDETAEASNKPKNVEVSPSVKEERPPTPKIKSEKELEERFANLQRMYKLRSQSAIIVHPSTTAKSGKFECYTMSLSSLLDYSSSEGRENAFEIAVFAEIFNEILQRDFGYNIYRALFNHHCIKKEEGSPVKNENDGEPDSKKIKLEKSDDAKKSKRNKDAKRMTFDPYLLLSFVYFDQNHVGYLHENDLTSIINCLGLKLSRAQTRKLVSKISGKSDKLEYRQLTDKILEDLAPDVSSEAAVVCKEEQTEEADTNESDQQEKEAVKSEEAMDTEQATENNTEDEIVSAIEDTDTVEDVENKDNEEVAIPEKIENPMGNLVYFEAPESSSPETSAVSRFVEYNGMAIDLENVLTRLDSSEKTRIALETSSETYRMETEKLKEQLQRREREITTLKTDLKDTKDKHKQSLDDTKGLKTVQDQLVHVMTDQKSTMEFLSKRLSDTISMATGETKNKEARDVKSA